jgi:glycosyltransferase involved in cell wall biosynthesis
MVHVLGSLDVGGAELRLLDLCRELRAEDSDQVFLTLAGRTGAIADQFEDVGARVVRCDLRPVSTFPARLFALLRRLRPDTLVSHVSLVSGLVLTVGRVAGIRSRIAWIRSDGDGRRSTLPRRLMRLVLRELLRLNATAVVAVNPAALRFGLSRPERWRRGTARVIPNGVDTSRFVPRGRDACRRALGLPDDCLVLLHLGRAAPEKNRPFLVEVLAALRARGVAARLVLAGPGGEDDVTAAHPEVLDDPSVVFLGQRDDVPTLLGAADVLLLPSTREGMPGVLLEALSSGVPVVSNDLPGPSDVSRSLPGVYLVSLRAGAAAWAQAVLLAARGGAHEPADLHEAVVRSPYALATAARTWRTMW